MMIAMFCKDRLARTCVEVGRPWRKHDESRERGLAGSFVIVVMKKCMLMFNETSEDNCYSSRQCEFLEDL